MDISTFLTSLAGTGLISVALARWLTERLVEHRLSRALKDHDADIQRRFTSYKAELDAKLRIEVEDLLGEKAAERQYRVEAKKRLYAAVGPLRFQLLLAANEFSNRVARLGDTRYVFDTSLDGYFGRSTSYRLLRMFAVLELIERQIAYADFAVDPFFPTLLRFKKLAFSCLSSDRVSLDHPANDWNNQNQHIFYDTLSAIASRLVVADSQTGERVMRFDEYNQYVSNESNQKLLAPLPRLFTGFSPQQKPVLWLRLLTLATLCQAFSKWQGKGVGLENLPLEWRQLLINSGDTFIQANIGRYEAVITEHDKAFPESEH
ncbi:hypothetical protein RG836_23720 [Pseudomonas sp. SZMC_28357]|uniref:hypothetical protein n=1 Tax=Pseudomonas sp. SZMC_28357 TaxID=3074380 RepID=UPI002870C706|nr:hypothetical protein [Pseudomonas sp. SZMC_28357]MDR9754456.1 hypothetical protein [Pseudomonas sp. SZMC_28357]